MDDKGRIRIPESAKSVLGEEPTAIYQGIPGVLKLMDRHQYESYRLEIIEMFHSANTDAQAYREHMTSNKRFLNYDSGDRITIPADLRKSWKVNAGKVVIVANGTECLIYGEAEYNAKEENAREWRRSERRLQAEMYSDALSMEQMIRGAVAPR